MRLVIGQIQVELRRRGVEGVVRREQCQLIPAGKRDGVFVVVPAHPGHLGELPGVGVEHDRVTGLSLHSQRRVGAVGCSGGHVHDVVGLLIGQVRVGREALGGSGHRSRAEPQVAVVGRDRHRRADHRRCGRVEGQLGYRGIDEVGRAEEGHGGLLVADERLHRPIHRPRPQPNAIGDSLERETVVSVAAADDGGDLRTCGDAGIERDERRLRSQKRMVGGGGGGRHYRQQAEGHHRHAELALAEWNHTDLLRCLVRVPRSAAALRRR